MADQKSETTLQRRLRLTTNSESLREQVHTNPAVAGLMFTEREKRTTDNPEPRKRSGQPKLSSQMTQTEGSEENEEGFLWRSEPFVSFVSFCKKFLRGFAGRKIFATRDEFGLWQYRINCGCSE